MYIIGLIEYHGCQVVTNQLIDETVVIVYALLVDIVGKSEGHNACPRDGETVDLHLRKHIKSVHPNIKIGIILIINKLNNLYSRGMHSVARVIKPLPTSLHYLHRDHSTTD
jgi:hypothetical protein